MNNFAIRPAGVVSRIYASKSVKNTEFQLPTQVKQFFKTHKDTLLTLDRAGLHKLISGSDEVVQDFFLNYAKHQGEKAVIASLIDPRVDRLFLEYQNYQGFEQYTSKLPQKQKTFFHNNVDHLVNFDRVDLVNLKNFLNTLQSSVVENLELREEYIGNVYDRQAHSNSNNPIPTQGSFISLGLVLKGGKSTYISDKLYATPAEHPMDATRFTLMPDSKWQIAKGKEEYLKGS